MSGHSKWSTIKRQKGANDAKRGQIFTKLANTISVAAKHGSDPSMNPSLALAIAKAKDANMPNANVERAVKRGAGELGGEQIQEYLFEGYGPGGVGIIVEAASDNRNRTSADVRAAFSKNGGNLAEVGAVAFQFERKGVLRIKSGLNMDETTMIAIECGAEDIIESDDELIVYSSMKDFHNVNVKLGEAKADVVEADLQYVPKELVPITDKTTANKIIKLMEAIEDLDDVTNTYSNFDIDDQLLAES